MKKRKRKFRSLTAPTAQYIGFATISYGVALYEGATLIGGIPTALVASGMKFMFVLAHKKVFPDNK